MSILPQTMHLLLPIYGQLLAQAFGDGLYADLLSRCQNHLLVKIAERLDLTALVKACSSYHHQAGAGRPASYSIDCLVRATLVGWLYALSLRELEQRLRSDLLVRWFVGLGLWDETPDHTTLERFVLWVMAHQPEAYFMTVFEQVLSQFPHEGQLIQIGDSYAMRADAADESLGRRLRHVCERLLVALARVLPGELEQAMKGYQWVNLFGMRSEPGDWRLNSQERKQRVSQIALAAEELHQRVSQRLTRFAQQAYPQVRQWLDYLSKVLVDELRLETDESGQRVANQLPKDHKGSFRLIGAADPEASLRAHGPPGQIQASLGYNVQIAVSTSGFIHATQAYTGALSDPAGVAGLLSSQIERFGTCPPKLIYDKAAGAGKTRWQVEQVSQGRCQLSAYLPEPEHSERFGPYDFYPTPDHTVVTCPGGKVAPYHRRADEADGEVFIFRAWQCWNGPLPVPGEPDPHPALARRCPLWEQCRDPKASPRGNRTVFISDYRSQVLAAQAYNQSLAFEQDMQLRPRVERTVFELTHYNGARRCRRRGLAQADFQAKMCATAYNLKLWMRRTGKLARPVVG